MKAYIPLLAAALLATTVTAGDEKADLAKLEGTWEVTALEVAGKPAPLGPEGLKLVVKGKKLTLFAGDKAVPNFNDVELRLDPTKKPKTADCLQEGKDTLPCIYDLS